MIQVRSNVDPTFYSLVGSGRSGGDHHGSSLLDNPYIPYQCMDSYLSSTGLGSASMGKSNGAPNNVSSQTKNYEIAPFILGRRRDRTIRAFFFHAFPGGLEKAAINRIFLTLPSRKEEREILFPFRRDQEIGSSRKKNAWLINNSLLGLRPPQSLRTPPIGAMGCVYLSIS